ncbi:MAG: hypothetical protein DME93_06570 [Verrucomicrobia bacterium]|nr:MAG: hypothetical protein DME93_06570 [Verrucomicrobiota bacterium]
MKSKWQNAAIIIGLVGGIISIPKSTIEGWQTIFSRPKLDVERSVPVSIAYDPKNNVLRCSFGMLLFNAGNKAEIIKAFHAQLRVPDDPKQCVLFSDSGTVINEDKNAIGTVFTVRQNDSKSLTCEITVDSSDPIRGLFKLQPKTARELVVELVGEDQSYHPAAFHFEFGEDVLKELFDPEGRGSITFYGSEQ